MVNWIQHGIINRRSLSTHDILKSGNLIGTCVLQRDDSAIAKKSRKKYQTLFLCGWVHVRRGAGHETSTRCAPDTLYVHVNFYTCPYSIYMYIHTSQFLYNFLPGDRKIQSHLPKIGVVMYRTDRQVEHIHCLPGDLKCQGLLTGAGFYAAAIV